MIVEVALLFDVRPDNRAPRTRISGPILQPVLGPNGLLLLIGANSHGVVAVRDPLMRLDDTERRALLACDPYARDQT